MITLDEISHAVKQLPDPDMYVRMGDMYHIGIPNPPDLRPVDISERPQMGRMLTFRLLRFEAGWRWVLRTDEDIQV